jgi:hypothetical protein
MSSPVSIQQVKSIILPCSAHRPGPLHTIQVDNDGCIYCSDELNHRVHSLDSSGRMRWQAGAKGLDPGQFHYPCGISLGRIIKSEVSLHCLAVADSWNGRIQFLGLGGEFLTQWGIESNIPFGEPVDVRFISSNLPADSVQPVGVWLVLDKSKHRLWTIDCSGRVLRRNGTCMDPGKAAEWIACGKYPNFEKMDLASAGTTFPYDFLYYPNRILGGSVDSLFISEPLRRNLKLVKGEDFIPLSLGSFEDREWVSADVSGLIEWSYTGKCIQTYNGGGQPLRFDQIEGIPVPSNLPSNELFIQHADSIDHIRVISRPPDTKGLSTLRIDRLGSMADNNFLRQ